MQGKSSTPNRIPFSVHQIPRTAVSKPALETIDTLQSAGYEAYLVGGCVRDLLLHHTPKDFDVATSAYPEQVRELFRRCRLIGRRFRLAHVRFGKEVVEVATFRAQVGEFERDEYHSDLHKVTEAGQILRDNVYGGLEEDAFRRDFTVNALYYDPRTEEVIDYVDGVEHLKARRLMTIGDPETRFREDPVRMLRAVRFAAKPGFDLCEKMTRAITTSASFLLQVPPSRLLDEVLKLFHNGHALDNFTRLRELGLFRYIFPFTEQCMDDAERNLVVLALENTDLRVREGKPVIPAFLFACLLWEPLERDAEKLAERGAKPRAALATAQYDLLRDQSTHVSIPRRIGLAVREIWSIQGRLQRRPPKSIITLLRHPRFRAAYDFLLLRCEIGEVPPDVAAWWTRIQEVDPGEQQRMIKALGPAPRRGRRRRRRRAA